MYDLKVYECGREKETIRNLTYAQMIVIRAILSRYDITFKVLEILPVMKGDKKK